jgi:hypothetical protein
VPDPTTLLRVLSTAVELAFAVAFSLFAVDALSPPAAWEPYLASLAYVPAVVGTVGVY